MSVDLPLTISSVVAALLRLGALIAWVTLFTVSIGPVAPLPTVPLEQRQELGDKPTQ